METSQKKLEELMYLSLIGEYAYLQFNGAEKIVCFKGALPFCHNIVKPICLTSDRKVSDKIVEERLKKFENKVLAETSNLHKKQLESEKVFSLDKKVKLFVSHYYKNDSIFEIYKSNLESLHKGGMINEVQKLGAMKYVENMRTKLFDKQEIL